MNCNSCNECSRKVYVSTVTFAAGTLTLNFPDTVSYGNGCKFCFVITTAIPDTATINAPVVVTIGAGTTEFPLLTRCGAQVVAQQLRTRRRYAFRVSTNATGGNIIVTSCLPDVESINLAALNQMKWMLMLQIFTSTMKSAESRSSAEQLEAIPIHLRRSLQNFSLTI